MSLKILVLGADKQLQDILSQLCPDCEIDAIDTTEQFENRFEEFHDGMYAFTVTGHQLGIDFCLESGQLLASECPKTPHFVLLFESVEMDRQILKKNGFSHVFLYPLDKEFFEEKVFENLDSDKVNARSFRGVRVNDLKSGAPLNFDTYVHLPLNRKYVKFSNAEQELPEEKRAKLNEKEYTKLFIEKSEISKFYEYSANVLAENYSGTGPLSETEREEKLRESVRDLFLDILDPAIKGDFESGREMVVNCQKIISNFITDGASDQWYNRLISAVGGQTGGYSHAADTSTFAALFSMVTKEGQPEDLAIAGFFHDIGLTDFPEDKRHKSEDWTPEEKALYEDHPKLSVEMLKKKRVIINDQVRNAILKHHEMFNGKGFPKQLVGDRIPIEAQILSLADQFSYLTGFREGAKRFTIQEALEEISNNGSIGPGLLRKIRKLFEEKPSEDAQEAI